MEIEISNGVTKIGEHGFYWCNKLETIYLPDTITDIREGVFS